LRRCLILKGFTKKSPLLNMAEAFWRGKNTFRSFGRYRISDYMGLRPVLVHGGGPNISERMKTSGKKTDFLDGVRVTDAHTLNIVEEELCR